MSGPQHAQPSEHDGSNDDLVFMLNCYDRWSGPAAPGTEAECAGAASPADRAEPDR